MYTAQMVCNKEIFSINGRAFLFAKLGCEKRKEEEEKKKKQGKEEHYPSINQLTIMSFM